MKYLLGVFATVFILIAAIFWVANSGNDKPANTADKQTLLTEYADSSAKVIYEIHGELVGDGERQAVRITIDRNKRLVEILDGYQQKVVTAKEFNNNSAAFEEFMYGLSRAGFVKEKKANYDSEKGVCPTGNISIYKVLDSGDDVSRLWASSCNSKDGSFDGSRGLVKNLFEDQIPEYRTIVRGVKL